MDLWINIARDALVAAISEVDCVILNDSEVELFTGEREVVAGARKIMEHGPSAMVVKLGKYGAALVTPDDSFWIPAFPVDFVADPTGAGDSFAGGFVGCIAAHGGEADAPTCCASRWPTARRSRPTTSRSSAPSASRG